MTSYLTLGDAIRVIAAAIGAKPVVRDWGLLESALARPGAVVFGYEAYPMLADKAAALLHSLVANHPLLDGNKRAGFACAAVFCHINGYPLTLSQDEAYDLTMAVACGDLSDTAEIARRLRLPANPFSI